MRRLRAMLALWERSVAAFAISPWASGVWILYCVAWVVAEAFRGKWPGWDGVAAFLAGEWALATYRFLTRRKDDS